MCVETSISCSSLDFESGSVVSYTGTRSGSANSGSVTGDYGLLVEESGLGPDRGISTMSSG